MMVITAVTSHAAISRAGEPSDRDISAETMKMPDPIIEPVTIAVAENSPIPCTNCGAGGASTCNFSELFTFVFSTVKAQESLPPSYWVNFLYGLSSVTAKKRNLSGAQ